MYLKSYQERNSDGKMRRIGRIRLKDEIKEELQENVCREVIILNCVHRKKGTVTDSANMHKYKLDYWNNAFNLP